MPLKIFAYRNPRQTGAGIFYVNKMFPLVRWKCALCGEECANLAVHVGRNHAEQEFQCGLCEVRVGSEYLLKVHEKTHTTEATPCNLCGKVVKVSKYRYRQILELLAIRYSAGLP
jgi:hypothetical protein